MKIQIQKRAILASFILMNLGIFLIGINNIYASSENISPSEAYPDERIQVNYDSNDCLVEGNGKVTIGGIEANIENWYKCLGVIDITIPKNTKSGDVVVYTYSEEIQNVGYLTIYQSPVITSIFPTTIIPGVTEVTIKGNRFGDSKEYYDDVYFNGVKVKTIRSWSNTEIIVIAPTGITNGKISIKINHFDEIYGNSFSLLTPVITSISPTVIIPGMTLVTIKGQNFGEWYENDDIFFDGMVAREKRDVVSWTDTEIEVFVPEEVTKSGKVSIKKGSWGVSIVYGPSFSIQKKVSNDTYSNFQTSYLELINAPQAWNITTGNQDVVVAVIDDGVYINHPDLRNNIWINKNEVIGNKIDDDGNGYIDDIYGWDFISNEGEMTARGSHGTMVAGILGAIGNNNEGIAGINWKAKIMPLIVCDNSSGCFTNTIDDAIKYAADNGANIINISLGTYATTGYSTKYNDAIKYAYNKGVVIVAAAGNGDIEGDIGQNLDIVPQSPVCNDNEQNMVIGVGSVDNNGYRTSWSNFGKYVDIYAPGENIVSAQAPIYSTVEGFYKIGDGTSFSAPIVSGAAALLKAKYPTMPNYEIRNRLIKNSNNGILDIYKTLKQSYSYSFVKKVDGTLIKTKTDSTIYIIESGKKRPISSVEVFNAMGYNWNSIITVAQGEIDIYPLGSAITSSGVVFGISTMDIPEGALIRAIGDIDVYIVKYVGAKKFKRLVLSPSVFNNYGHLRWEDVMDIEQSAVNSFATSELVRSVNDHKVYKLYPQGDTGQKRWIKDYNVFTRMGFDTDSIYEINEFDRDSYITETDLE